MCKMYHIKLLSFTGYEKSAIVSICFYSRLLEDIMGQHSITIPLKIENFQNLRPQSSLDVCEI